MKDFKNMKDADLDKLFQESADQSVPDFKESSWDKMAALLDDNEAPVNTWWKKPLIYSSIILLLLSISYVGIKVFDKEAVKNSIKGESNLGEVSNVLSSPKGERSTRNVLDENTEKEIVIGAERLEVRVPKLTHKKMVEDRFEVKSRASDLKNRELAKGKSRLGEVLGDEVMAPKKGVKVNAESSSKNMNWGEVVPEEGFGVEFSKASDENELTLENQKQVNKQSFKSEMVSLSKLAAKDLKPLNVSFNTQMIVAPEKVTMEIAEIENPAKGFGLRLAFSPDFSVVPENSFFKIGHNWAALLEYRFNNKWSIQTGVIKSLKYYQANPAQYKWPEAWGDAPAELNQIDARCSMIDIPFNIRYDFTTTRNRWFAQAGFTSYLMLKENYDYIFARNYNDQVWKSWEGKTGFYPAGVINLSGGLERRIFKKMSIQIEPFFKVPVGKVGYGKVKLATAGLFISTKLPLRN